MEVLRELRGRAALSVRRAALELGVTRAAVYSWESGAKRPSPPVLRRALDLYGASEEERCQVAHFYALGESS